MRQQKTSKMWSLWMLLACCLFGLSWACQSAQEQDQQQAGIRIAVAANMQYAMQQLVEAYQLQEEATIALVSGSSGKLTQQILHGAPFDILVSADTAYPQKLAAAGLTLQQPEVYAQGSLVLWTTQAALALDTAGLVFSDPAVLHVALANPQTAPYGAAAWAWLQQRGLLERVKPKLVVAESISQASQFIGSGHASIGFTAKSVVLSEAMRDKGQWVALQGYPRIAQAAALLKHAEESDVELARDFYSFLYSDKAKEILKQAGYQ